MALLDDRLLGGCQRIAAAFREAGIPAEVYPEKKKLAVQFAWAEKKGIPLALLFGEEESSANLVGLKDLRTRESVAGLTVAAAIERAKALLR